MRLSIDVATYFQVDGGNIVATLTRMGRKPLSDEDRRDKPFRIRMTDEERSQVDAAAEAAGRYESPRKIGTRHRKSRGPTRRGS